MHHVQQSVHTSSHIHGSSQCCRNPLHIASNLQEPETKNLGSSRLNVSGREKDSRTLQTAHGSRAATAAEGGQCVTERRARPAGAAEGHHHPHTAQHDAVADEEEDHEERPPRGRQQRAAAAVRAPGSAPGHGGNDAAHIVEWKRPADGLGGILKVRRQREQGRSGWARCEQKGTRSTAMAGQAAKRQLFQARS